MTISFRGNNGLLSRLKALAKLQRFNHTLMDGGLQAQFHREMASASVPEQGNVDISKWKKVDSRTCGITRSMISSPSWVVLKVLQSEGFEAYLVGGCVRDLLLNRIPKDFDVITTAKLKQIRKYFHRATIVGRRFPICMVNVKGSVVEVSSFETVAKHDKGKEKHLCSQILKGCDERDIRRWRNSMRRDFTVNSLFYDPFANKIYDYTNGMMDLKSLKLRTLVPAQLSFEEDCARILRGLRIAARLGLSISKDTVTAIHKLSSSIASLSLSRIMMELNYMLSYGAAEPSLCLLRRFNLLKILLPFHAAYLDQQAGNHASERSMMLMRLFSNLDNLVTCDRPSSCSLWIGLLAFHLALVNKPQDPLVVWTFSSVLYHGTWQDGVKYARKHVQEQANCLPEISEPCDYKSDRELAEKVTQFASFVQASIDPLMEKDSLFKSMSRFPLFPCSGLVFVPRKVGKDVVQLFKVLVDNVESYNRGRKNFKFDYDLLGKGDLHEIRFALGKVIMDTVSSGIFQADIHDVKETSHPPPFECKQKPHATLDNHLTLSDVIKHQFLAKEDKKRRHSQSNPEVHVKREKRQRLVVDKKCSTSQQVKTEKKQTVVKDMKCLQKVVEKSKCQETVEKHSKTIEKMKQNISQEEIQKKNLKILANRIALQDEVRSKPRMRNIINQKEVSKGKNSHLPQEEVSKGKDSHLPQEEVREKNEKHKLVKEKRTGQPLSSLFK